MFNRFRKRFLPFVLVVLALGLVNCSGMPLLFSKAEPVKLKFVYLNGSADYQSLAEMFHRSHKNIDIELVPIDQGTGSQNFQSEALTANTIRIPSYWPPELIHLELLSLDSLITTSYDFPDDDLFPGSLDALKLDGHQMGIPAGLNPYGIFYMNEKFLAAGVQVPAPGWQLDDFLAAAQAINNQGENVPHDDRFTYAFCTHPMLLDPIIFTHLFGGSLVDNPKVITRPTLNTQANIDAVKWYISLKSDMGLLPTNTRNLRNISLWIGNSNCGFWMDSLDQLAFGDRIKKPVAMLPLPGYKSSFEFATLDYYGIRAGSDHPEESFQWISFLMEQQAASGRLIPPLKSQIGSKEYASRAAADVLAVALRLPEQTFFLGIDMYHNNRFGIAMSLYNQAVAKALEGSSDVESALNEAQAQAEQEFYK